MRFPSELRISSASDISVAVKEGKKLDSRYFSLYVSVNLLNKTRLGLIVSKKVGNSVRRNRIKRLLREAFKYIKEVKLYYRKFKKIINKYSIHHNGGNHRCFIYVNLNSKKFANNVVDELITKNIFVRGKWPKPFDKGILISGTTFKNFKKFFN